ncbi:MAG: hypothetical protein H0V30_10230 [Chitinophagaceae bacterium]|nr:hypothetical protein [Chitinophagaceae bacterium]
MTPDPADWTFEKQKDNPSRLIRIKQLDILINIFLPNINDDLPIKSKIENLIKGEFILTNNIENYKKLFLTMDETIDKSKYSFRKMNDWTLDDLQSNYENLIKFKKLTMNLLEFNDGIMEISYPYLFSVILTENIATKISLKSIDNLLATVIDPQKRTLTKAFLVKNYEYPLEDVYDIDLDNW